MNKGSRLGSRFGKKKKEMFLPDVELLQRDRGFRRCSLKAPLDAKNATTLSVWLLSATIDTIQIDFKDPGENSRYLGGVNEENRDNGAESVG